MTPSDGCYDHHQDWERTLKALCGEDALNRILADRPKLVDEGEGWMRRIKDSEGVKGVWRLSQ